MKTSEDYSFDLFCEDENPCVTKWREEAERQQDAADYYFQKYKEWRARANVAKNLADNLAWLLQALTKKGLLHLSWRDGSASYWHNLPESWRKFIVNG